MISMLIGSSIAACIIYGSASWKDTDLRKMKHVFRNTNYRVGDRVPRLIKQTSNGKRTEYVFSVPYGLVDDKKLQPILQKTLAKPVVVKFKGKLIITVYKWDLPRKITYDWRSSSPWCVPIGYSLNGQITHNFDEIPHMTVAGMTRQGKTVFLKLLLAHLINNNDEIQFHIFDLKGGLEFGRYSNLKQITKVISDVGKAGKQLSKIIQQMRSDMKCFKSRGYNNIVNTNINKRTFIVVDEAAELDKKCQEHLSEIARIGGALGYRLIFATQYPTADTLPRQIKQNSDAKISFRLPTGVASRVAIDEQGAEEISNVGRAIYRTHERVEIQVPYVKDEDIIEKLRRFEVDKNTRENQQTRENIIEFS